MMKLLQMVVILLVPVVGSHVAWAQKTDPDKTILQQLNEYEAKRRKAEEERAAKRREEEKLTPVQRAELACKRYAAETGKHECRIDYLRRGYKDAFRGVDRSHSHSGPLVVMVGPDDAVVCYDQYSVHDYMHCGIVLEKVDDTSQPKK